MDEIATKRRPRLPLHSPSDAEIIQRVLTGHRDEYALLVERYLPMLEGYFAGRGLRGADLDEAVQTAMITAYRRLGKLRRPGSFGKYLLKVAGHSFPRRRRAEVKLADMPADVPDVEQPDEPWRDHLREATARLPAGMQVVVALKYGEDLTAEAIAERLGQTVGSVTKTLSRAYSRLRDDPELARFSNKRGEK